MDYRDKRLKILTRREIEDIYGFPEFTHADRIQYFALSESEEKALLDFRTFASRLHFILALGYFKYKRQFYALNPDATRTDALHIAKNVFHLKELPAKFAISRPTRSSIERRILSLTSFRPYDRETTRLLRSKCDELVRLFTNPACLFRELMSFLDKSRVVLPAYSRMQNIIGNSLREERLRLDGLAGRLLSEAAAERLDRFLKESEQYRHQLTILKKEPKDFSFKQIREEISRTELLKDLYLEAENIPDRFGISNENVRYYASLVDYHTVYKLRRMKKETRRFYLTCFVFCRYRKIMDNLVITFNYYVDLYQSEAREAAKERVYNHKLEAGANLGGAGEILGMFMDDGLADSLDFGTIRRKAFGILERELLPVVARYVSGQGFDEREYQWRHCAKLAPRFKKNVRPVFRAMDVEGVRDSDLGEAVSFLKTTFEEGGSLHGKSRKSAPPGIVPRRLAKYFYREASSSENVGKTLNMDKYEFQAYRLLRAALDSGDAFVNRSDRFRNLDDELIDDERWSRREELIDRLGFPYLNRPVEEILENLRIEFEEELREVNDRIANGANDQVVMKRKGDKTSWSFVYEDVTEVVNHPIYRQFQKIDLNALLGFVDAFSHIAGRYSKTRVDKYRIKAAIVACAVNMGLLKMSETSDMSYADLSGCFNGFVRLETLKEANDRISNETMKLPIFRHYCVEKDVLHSSSDGQKYETQFDTIRSRHSKKYLGTRKGVSCCTLVINHIPANAGMIGSNEHESYSVYDLLYNNTSEIKPKRHSTDTHGSNEVNSAILDIFGYDFMPRYKRFSGKINNLVGFQHPSRYEGFIVRPIRKANLELIRAEWDRIKKIMLSLALKTTSQSAVVRKLNSHKRKNRTKRALAEYDAIIRSRNILRYMDSPRLRKSVQTVLNRGESYNKLRKAIPYINAGRIKARTELEQEVWSECTRLVANAVIHYNSFILSELLRKKEEAQSWDDAELIKNVSPVAWRHINFYGRYEFLQDTDPSAELEESLSILMEQNLSDISK